MIARIPDEQGGKQVLKEKLNEVIDFMNGDPYAQGNMASDAKGLANEVDSEDISDSAEATPFSFEGWTQSLIDNMLVAPVDYLDETGNPIVGIVPLSKVPNEVAVAYQAWKAAHVTEV